MPQNIPLSALFDFAIQQMAAESYIHRITSEGLSLSDVLEFGNNNLPIGQLNNPDLPGKTRFVDLAGVPNANQITGSAQAFVSRYQIIDHHANDATGFSATLMRDTQTGEYTLSFRSLEYQNHAQGGDWERDGQGGAAGEIAGSGFALGQLVSMERYFADLEQGKLTNGAIDPVLQAFFVTQSNTINVSGYSLGGHLATVFTVLHERRVNHTYIFNGAGIGQVGGVTPVLTEDIRIQQLIGAMDAKFVEFDPSGNLTRSGAPANVQTLSWYQPAVIEVAVQFQTTGTASMPTGGLNGGVTRIDGAFNKITQLFGAGVTGGDVQFVANSGIHGPVQSVLIEGQPLIESIPLLQESIYGNAHSITLIVDSLALQELFQTIDSVLTQTQIETILKAASAAQADRFAIPGEEHTAEGDTLEKALDGLRKVFLDAGAPPTGFNDDTGGFGDLTFRNEFYTHLAEVKTQLSTTFAGQTFRIQSLVGQPSNDIRVASAGTEPTSLAYRFALKELTPFAVLGSTDTTTQTLYDRHNETGELTLVNPETGIGELTPQYLIDRAAFLAKKIEVNSNASSGFNFTHFHDNLSGYDIAPILTLRQMVFGDGTNETLTGGTGADHFYGGSGDDHPRGLENNDYLEGNRGDDTLDGGSGADTMLGGQGNDVYIVDNVGDVAREYANSGIDIVHSSVTFTLDREVENLTLTGSSDINGTGNELDNLITGNDGINRLDGKGGMDRLIGGGKNDILIGGRGNHDLLEGGAGFDTYIYHAGDGIDLIEDSDATGQIIFDQTLLQAGIRRTGDAVDTYTSLDGSQTYVISGGHLIVNGMLTVNADFQSGQFGIQLRDVSEANYENGLGTTVWNFGEGNDILAGIGDGNHVAHMGGGNDLAITRVNIASGNDQLFGEDGNDQLYAGGHDDRLYGGNGEDLLVGDNVDPTTIDGEDLLDGGVGNDLLIGGFGDDVLLGGEGTDVLWGDYDAIYPDKVPGGLSQNDFLDGGAGDDELHGIDGDDVLFGGTGNDFLSGEAGDDVEDGGAGNDLLLASIGNDSLAGGAGIDQLYGDQDNDSLDGGDDADTLHGGDGTDSLFGGAGDDVLFGDGLNNPSELSATGGADFLDGGAGNDHLEGGIGDDTLFGGTENDVLFGDEGADVLAGDDGDDVLQGGADHDQLFGDAGTDRLFGQAGDDDVAGGEGNDLLVGGDGDDFLDGEAGVDRLEGGAGQDLLVGGAGNDTLLGEADDDQLFGDEGDDVLNSGTGNNLLFGGEGNDQLIGGGGVDELDGGAGNDELVGGGGADTYVFSAGDGEDRIVDTSGEGNKLVLGAGISNSSIGLGIGASGLGIGSLLIRVGLNGDLIRLPGFNPSQPTQSAGIDQFVFADGTTLTHAQLVARGFDLVGTAGDDVLDGGETYQKIFGLGGHDFLIAGTGDNIVFGGLGNDLVLGNSGDDQLFGEAGNDTLQGGAGHDRLEGNLGDDLLSGDGGMDVLLGGEGLDILGGADEADWLEGGSGDDWLDAGSDDDLLIGGVGNDRLEGGAGHDTYQFNRGDGLDQLWDSAVPEEGNTLAFGTGIGLGDLQLDLTLIQSDVTPSDLVVRIGPNGDAITFATFGTFDRNDVGGAHSVDQFRSADGTVVPYAQLIARGFDLLGTASSETILGTNVTDRILAGAGDDRLRSGRGDDVLDGGAGNDRLEGGQGNDTYVFGSGTGQDRVLDIQGTADVVRLAAGVSPGDVAVTQTDRDIILSLNGGADQLSLSLARLAPLFRIEQVQFADGTVWDAAFLEELASNPLRGTEQADVLQGTARNERFFGFGGADQIAGLAGDDVLDGGTGADLLAGGVGDDAYVIDQSDDVVTEQANEGTDTVQTDVSYQLSAHVEHLMLNGTSAINGTGNTLNNVLTGNSAANVLTGGLGDDTYVVGAEDTVVELAGEGSDTAISEVGTTLGANVENLTIAGSRSLAGTGNALDNVLSAPGSMSTLAGGLGDDIYLVGPGDDVDIVVELANGGIDTVRAARSYRLPDHVERLELLDAPSFHASSYATADPSTVYAGLIRTTEVRVNLFGLPSTVDGIGNALDNVLIGNRDNNILDGGAGRDTYVLRRGMGHDEVHDYSRSGEIDRVDVAADLAPSQVNLLRHQGDLVLHVTGTNDWLRLSSFFLSPDAAMKEVRFADGTVWARAFLEASAVSVGAIPTGVTDDSEYVVGRGGTVGTEGPGEGIDSVHAFIDYTLPDYVENLTLADELGGAVASPRMGTGNHLDNLLIGNMSDNVLDGGAGNDILVGGFFRSIDNQALGDVGSDILIGGEGDDMLIPVVPYAEFPTDTGGQDRFESSPNTPDDVLVGGRGHDTYVLTHADQTVVERPGEGIDTVRSMVDYTLGTEVENLTLIDNPLPFLPFALQGTGNERDNVMIGNLAGNVLRGEGGEDTLWGGASTTGDEEEELPENAGNDQLIGGSGHDTYVFNLGDSIDTIEDAARLSESNRIQFGTGIRQTDLTFTHDQTARTLTIQLGSSGTDQLRLINFDPTNANGSLVVETLAFADGTTASLAALLGLGGPINHAPTVVSSLANQTAVEDTAFTFAVSGSTFTDVDAGDVLTYSATLADGTAFPTWLSFDPITRTFSGTPLNSNVGTLALTVTATDQGNLSASTGFTLAIQSVNDVPTVSASLADQQATEDAPFSFVVAAGSFTDVDAGDTLTYSATLANGSPLPAWLSFNAATWMFTGMPLNSDVGTLNVAVTAIDLGGLSATDTFALTIQNVNDAPTVANPFIDQTVLEGAPFSIQVPGNTFADQDMGDALSYGATLADGTTLPTWLSFSGTTRTFTGTPDDAQVGSLDLRVTATDTGNLTVSDVFTLTVTNVNDAPTVVAPLADQQATQGTAFSLVVPATTFADEDAGDVLTYSATLANGASLPSWLSFNSATRTFNGTPLVGDVGAIDVRVTATDQGNLNAADVFALTIAPSGGTAGNDTLIGTSGNDVLDGLTGDDVLRGLAGNDTLIGGGGNDLLDGGPGADSMTGGTGSDTYVVSTGDTVVEAANAGTDTVLSNVSYTLAANVELLVLTGTNAINGTGNSLVNGITGNAAANVLDGGASADVLAGLDGNDTYLVDNAGDLIVELANNGIDQVQSSVTFTLGANVENLALTGTAAINGTGNGSANVMIGNGGANVLSGAGGADTLRGGLGNDTVNGGSGNDTFLFGRGDGQDLVQDNSGTADKLLYDAGINPLDLVISRQANNLRLSIHGSTDHVTIQNWYASSANRTETIQAGNGQTLLNTQVDQLIQAMAGFTAQTGLTWDQAIDQRPQDVQTVLAASWQ